MTNSKPKTNQATRPRRGSTDAPDAAPPPYGGENLERDGVAQGTHADRAPRARVDIPARTFALALRLLKVVDALPKSVSGQTIARQLARSGLSIGANVEEAQGSHSRAEFARRMGIARSEARETLFWLRLIEGHGLLSADRLAAIRAETDAILRILTTIVKRTRANATRPL